MMCASFLGLKIADALDKCTDRSGVIQHRDVKPAKRFHHSYSGES